MERFATSELCLPGALVSELRQLGFWNSVPGSSTNPTRMALQND